MGEEHPYRSAAAPELVIGWETDAQALAGARALVAILRAAGVAVAEATLELRLRPRALAFVDADAEVGVFVAWEIAREANRILAEATVDARLMRAGERSPRFILLRPAELEARRAAGEVLLEKPPRVGPDASTWIRLAVPFAGLGTIVGALIAAGDYGALTGTLIAFVACAIVARTVAKRWKLAPLLHDVPLAIPPVALLVRGELLLFWIVAATLVLMPLVPRWLARAPRP